MQIKIVIVEDSAGICAELQHIIGSDARFTCVGVCRNAASALAKIPKLAPDVIIMDIQLPDGSGIECTERLKAALPQTEIVMFTINDDADHIVKALEAGASGYLLKDASAGEILSAISEVRTHGAPLSRDVARKLITSFRRPAKSLSAEPLTPRENEVLLLLSEGLLYKEIGNRLNIKVDTVGSHIKSLYRKLHVRSRSEAIMKYRR
jgi:DNA-binding NarL/FixJ family response regulator